MPALYFHQIFLLLRNDINIKRLSKHSVTIRVDKNVTLETPHCDSNVPPSIEIVKFSTALWFKITSRCTHAACNLYVQRYTRARRPPKNVPQSKYSRIRTIYVYYTYRPTIYIHAHTYHSVNVNRVYCFRDRALISSLSTDGYFRIAVNFRVHSLISLLLVLDGIRLIRYTVYEEVFYLQLH